MYFQWLIILLALRSAASMKITGAQGSFVQKFYARSTQAKPSLAGHTQTASFNNNCSTAVLDAMYHIPEPEGYQSVNEEMFIQHIEEKEPMSVRYNASDNGYYCGAGLCSDSYNGALLQHCDYNVEVGPGGYNNTLANQNCADQCDLYAWCDAFSFHPYQNDAYECYLHFEGGDLTCPTGTVKRAGVDAHAFGVVITGRKSADRCYHKGHDEAIGGGDPHIKNMYGDKFNLYHNGTVSLLRIPGYGKHAGRDFELSAVIEARHFTNFYMHGSWFSTDGNGYLRRILWVVRNASNETLPDTTAPGMVDMNILHHCTGAHSMSSFNLSSCTSSPLDAKQKLGNVKVKQISERITVDVPSENPLRLIIQWKRKHQGLNIRVEGLRHQKDKIGGALGADERMELQASLFKYNPSVETNTSEEATPMPLP